jgi:hypothetical protein
MISHQHRFIFVHVPRTGGTSVETVLRPYASISLAEPGSWPDRNRTWRNKFLFDSLKQHPDYYSFLFVRNPWDRFVSNWKYFYPNKDFNELIDDVARFLSLNPERLFCEVPNNYCTQGIKIPPYLHSSLTPFLKDNFGYHVLPLSYFLGTGVSFVGRFEFLERDWETVCKAIGIDEPLPRLNNSEHAHYAKYYNSDSRSAVAKIYQQDIVRFGYSFGE